MNLEMTVMRRFTLIMIAYVVLAVGMTAGINYLIDPYGVFGSPQFVLINRNKTQAVGQPHLAKAYLIETARPTTLLIGDSRVDVGLNPASSHWRTEYQPVFNLGIPGNPLPEHLRYLEHAFLTSHPSIVLLGLGFDDCFVWSDREQAAGPAAEQNARLRAERTDWYAIWQARFRDFTFASISLSALEDSIMTIINQDDPRQSYITANGWHAPGDFRRTAEAEGYYNVVMAKDRSRARTILDWAKTPRFDLATLEKIFELTSREDARLIIFLPPSYVDEFEIMKQVGVLEAYDSWKRTLVQLVSKATLAGMDIKLWDFNEINQYSTELLPGREDRRSELRWFWETNHFKAELGDQIISTLMGDDGSGLGQLLTPANIENQITLLHQGLALFEQSRQADVHRITKLISSAR